MSEKQEYQKLVQQIEDLKAVIENAPATIAPLLQKQLEELMQRVKLFDFTEESLQVYMGDFRPQNPQRRYEFRVSWEPETQEWQVQELRVRRRRAARPASNGKGGNGVKWFTGSWQDPAAPVSLVPYTKRGQERFGEGLTTTVGELLSRYPEAASYKYGAANYFRLKLGARVCDPARVDELKAWLAVDRDGGKTPTVDETL